MAEASLRLGLESFTGQLLLAEPLLQEVPESVTADEAVLADAAAAQAEAAPSLIVQAPAPVITAAAPPSAGRGALRAPAAVDALGSAAAAAPADAECNA